MMGKLFCVLLTFCLTPWNAVAADITLENFLKSKPELRQAEQIYGEFALYLSCLPKGKYEVNKTKLIFRRSSQDELTGKKNNVALVFAKINSAGVPDENGNIVTLTRTAINGKVYDHPRHLVNLLDEMLPCVREKSALQKKSEPSIEPELKDIPLLTALTGTWFNSNRPEEEVEVNLIDKNNYRLVFLPTKERPNSITRAIRIKKIKMPDSSEDIKFALKNNAFNGIMEVEGDLILADGSLYLSISPTSCLSGGCGDLNSISNIKIHIQSAADYYKRKKR